MLDFLRLASGANVDNLVNSMNASVWVFSSILYFVYRFIHRNVIDRFPDSDQIQKIGIALHRITNQRYDFTDN